MEHAEPLTARSERDRLQAERGRNLEGLLIGRLVARPDMHYANRVPGYLEATIEATDRRRHRVIIEIPANTPFREQTDRLHELSRGALEDRVYSFAGAPDAKGDSFIVKRMATGTHDLEAMRQPLEERLRWTPLDGPGTEADIARTAATERERHMIDAQATRMASIGG